MMEIYYEASFIELVNLFKVSKYQFKPLYMLINYFNLCFVELK